VTASPSFHIFA
jgi:hypothetical protein